LTGVTEVVADEHCES